MKFYKLALWKAYFETGYGITSYLKYAVFLFGFWEISATKNYKLTIIAGILYAILCFFIGWLVFKTKFYEATLEVQNQFNPLAKGLRTKLEVEDPIQKV